MNRLFYRMRFFLWDQRGVALVVTLAVIALLLAAGIGLSCFVGKQTMEIGRDKDLFQAEQWALSGIHFAMMVLCEDGRNTEIDSIQEPWADAGKMTVAANAVLGEKNKISLSVTDELSKVQVNALVGEFPGRRVNGEQVEILENLFSAVLGSNSNKYPGVDSSIGEEIPSPMALVNALIDWLDSGDDDAITGLSGAEKEYYQNLVPAYLPANGPFLLLDEICHVKGMDCVFLTKQIQAKYGQKRLSDLLTVHGLKSPQSGISRAGLGTESQNVFYPGKININTAPLAVLEALMPRGMENLARDLADFRRETAEKEDVFVNALDKGWYKKVIALSEREQKKLDRNITYESNVFRVESSAREHNARVTLVAFVRRDAQGTAQKEDSRQRICRIIQIQRK